MGKERGCQAVLDVTTKNACPKGQTFLVGARGFEPPTSSTPLKRATELRYAPTTKPSITRSPLAGKFKMKRVSFKKKVNGETEILTQRRREAETQSSEQNADWADITDKAIC
jgi:hypothetical protein